MSFFYARRAEVKVWIHFGGRDCPPRPSKDIVVNPSQSPRPPKYSLLLLLECKAFAPKILFDFWHALGSI